MVAMHENDGYSSFEKYREYLLFLAHRQLDRRLQAKIDLSGVVQQTLLEAHQALPEMRFENSAALMAAIRKILAGNLIDEIRKATAGKKDAYREQSLAEALDQSTALLENLMVADVSSPSDAIQRAERALQLTDALSRLLPAEREAIILKNWENMSLAEIGNRMERTPAAVAGLLKRGLHKLREEFARIEDSQ